MIRKIIFSVWIGWNAGAGAFQVSPACSGSKMHGKKMTFGTSFFVPRQKRLFRQAVENGDTTNGANSEQMTVEELDPEICTQFKILTCASTSCSALRKKLGMDEFATVGALDMRRENANAAGLIVEESTCLGACKFAPCVSVQHEDYDGNVGLEGMTEAELSETVFHRVITEDDIDRVWGCVENAIRTMADEEDDSDEDDEDESRYV
uniref:Uncharacterized protein n=1 Tax=Attheya septentrionalis TaxID=420275 RepID=A0A7S2UKQ3_9STRA|mmetsp:Transcript_29358/g.53772  ORF Transcript_29358/g.53772 Transcript_29358/m.53772 type:complete len:207 (+) Transcript_29358:431-1051(+)